MGRRGAIAVLGGGAVGGALASALLAAGREVRLWSRSRTQRRGRPRPVADLEQAVAGASAVLLCVPEPALEGLIRRLPAGSRVLVVSGVVELAPLRRGLARGALLGRFHPLNPVLPGARDAAFEGMPFGIEGAPALRTLARTLVRELGGFPLPLTGRDPAGYHAGAALLGGGLVALTYLAEQALASSVRSARLRRRAVLAFALRNLVQVADHGPVEALTGPIVRGAHANVRANLRALERLPGGREAYRELGRTMLALARRAARAEPAELARVERELARPITRRRGRSAAR